MWHSFVVFISFVVIHVNIYINIYTYINSNGASLKFFLAKAANPHDVCSIWPDVWSRCEI